MKGDFDKRIFLALFSIFLLFSIIFISDLGTLKKSSENVLNFGVEVENAPRTITGFGVKNGGGGGGCVDACSGEVLSCSGGDLSSRDCGQYDSDKCSDLGPSKKKEDCEFGCNSQTKECNPPRYSCINGFCDEDPNGAYESVAFCDLFCGTSYECVEGSCKEVAGNGGTYEDANSCQADCEKEVVETVICDSIAGCLIVQGDYGEFSDVASCQASGCSPEIVQVCGDGIIGGSEPCEINGISPAKVCYNGDYEGIQVCENAQGICQYSECKSGFCGDGNLEEFEECDDGNSLNGDGCSSSCVSGEIKLQTYICSNNNCALVLDGSGEYETLAQCSLSCGQNNEEKYEFISTFVGCNCQISSQGTLTLEECEMQLKSATCENKNLPVCGDGKLDGVEECDDGNSLNGDGCSNNCLIEETLVTCSDDLKTGSVEVKECRWMKDVYGYVERGSQCVLEKVDELWGYKLIDTSISVPFTDVNIPIKINVKDACLTTTKLTVELPTGIAEVHTLYEIIVNLEDIAGEIIFNNNPDYDSFNFGGNF